MSYESYEAALGDLSADAKAWNDLADTFSTVKSIVAGCEMGRFEMDGIGHMVGAETNYNDAQEAFLTLTTAAPAVFQAIADKLHDTKRIYEQADGYAQWTLDQG